ncbi:MAG: AAA family ATPase, partial [Candidatus Thermoplasmatota archaeon]
MYLKEIYLENFKSFGKRLRIPLLPGFTGITGPNGSGKSNILDAVLFVLGPKSSKVIRAGKLTDLIFNGGVTKQPADYCKVSLVFDNKDRTLPIETDEVTLTRLVKYANSYETQDYYSYFYINGRGSSLTEFENLLAYANISGEGYNIVQQGDVNSIVTMGSIERRKILDSIAGITKFDSDIEKSESEKIAIDANLEKIQIILEELNSRVSVLEEESKRALEYRNLRDELMLRKYQLCIKKRKSYEGELKRIKEEMEKYDKERSILEKEVEKLKHGLELENNKLVEIENKIAEHSGKELKELSDKIIKLRGESIKAKEGINYCNDTIGKLEEERSLVIRELSTNDKEITKLEREKQKLEKELEEKRAKAQETEKEDKKIQELIAKSDSTTRAIHKELAELKKEYEKLEEVLRAKKLAQATHNENIERISSELAQYKQNINTYEAELRNNNELIKELRKELKGYERKEQELNTKFSELTERANELQEKLKLLEPKIMRLQNYYSQLKAELSAEVSLYKGYTTAVNAILEARDRGELKGIHGTVSELGKTPKEYEQTLAIAAGGRLQAIVVDNDENATKAINYLKSRNLGRATFLPLNKLVKGYPAGKALLVAKDSNAVGFAIDLLKFDELYRNAFWYVFGSTIVMKDLESARKFMGGVRLVTLTNELLEASGAMTGGSIEKIVKFGSADSEYEKVGRELRAKLQEQEELSTKLSESKAELNNIENELKSIATSRELSINKLSILETKSKEYEIKLSALKTEESKLLEKLDSENGKLTEITNSITNCELRISELECKKDALSKALLESTPEQLAIKHEEIQKIR